MTGPSPDDIARWTPAMDGRPRPHASDFNLRPAQVRAWDFASGQDHTSVVTMRRLPSGRFVVSGDVTVRFVAADLAERVRRSINRHRNDVLRIIRPHMTKRAFQRMRGRIKARRKAQCRL